MAVAAAVWGPGWGGRAQQAGPELLIAAVDATPVELSAAHYRCDGVNDYVQGRAALAALPLSGGTLRFSSGHFDFGEENIIFHERPNIIVQGAGMDVTFISNDTDRAYDSEPLSYTRCDRAVVRDMTIHGAGAARNTADTLDFDDSDDCLVERVRITGARGRGIVFDGKDPGGDSFRNIIRDCIITGCNTDGIQLLCTDFCQIINTVCNFNGTGESSAYGVRIHHSLVANQVSNNNSVIGGEFVGNKNGGIAITEGDGNIIDGAYIANNVGDGVYVSTSSATSFTANDTIIRNCTITDTRSAASAKTQAWAIRLSGSPVSDISNTRILSNNLCGNRLGALVNSAVNTVSTNNSCGPTLPDGPTPTPTRAPTSTPVSDTAYFRDDFETSNLQKWDSVINYTINTGSAYDGSFGVRGQTSGSSAYMRGTLTQSTNEAFASMRFKLDSMSGSDISVLRLRTASSTSIIGVHVTSSGTLNFRNDVAAVSRQSTQQVWLGVWHFLEVRVRIDGASGLVETWLDGVRVNALCRTENLGANQIGRVQIGESSSGRSFSIAVDNVTVHSKCVFSCPASESATPTNTPTSTSTATPTNAPTASSTPIPTSVPAAAYFYDDFESGTLQRWFVVTNYATDSRAAFAGAFGVRGQATNTAAYIRGRLNQPVTQAWASMRFRLESQSSSDISLMRLRSTSNLSIVGLHATSSGTLNLRNDVTAVSRRSMQTVSMNVWHTLEMRARISGTSSDVEVWLNGNRIDSLCNIEDLGSTAIGAIQVGDTSSGRTFVISVDNVSVHDRCMFSCPVGNFSTPTATSTKTPTAAPSNTSTRTPSNTPTRTFTSTPSHIPTSTQTNTSVPSTDTPTRTTVPPTYTPVPPTSTLTSTSVPPTSTTVAHAFALEILSPVPPPSGGKVDVRVTLLSGSVPVWVNLRSSSANRAVESPDTYRFAAVGESITATLTDLEGADAPGGTTRLQAVVNKVVVAQTDPIPFPAG